MGARLRGLHTQSDDEAKLHSTLHQGQCTHTGTLGPL